VQRKGEREREGHLRGGGGNDCCDEVRTVDGKREYGHTRFLSRQTAAHVAGVPAAVEGCLTSALTARSRHCALPLGGGAVKPAWVAERSSLLLRQGAAERSSQLGCAGKGDAEIAAAVKATGNPTCASEGG